MEAQNTYAILSSRAISTPDKPWEYLIASDEFPSPMMCCDLIRTGDFELRAVTRTVLLLDYC